MHSCAEVCEPIELSFGEVSGVGRGMDVLDGGPRAPRRRSGFGEEERGLAHLFQWLFV